MPEKEWNQWFIGFTLLSIADFDKTGKMLWFVHGF